MKKRILSFLLCLCLLSGTGTALAASAGSSGDPLISLSYVENTWKPQVSNVMREILSTALAGFASPRNAPGTYAVSAGGSVKLSTGQTILLLSGKARIQIDSGSVVNAAVGAEAVSGSLNLYSRYILCEDSAATVSISEDALVAVSAGAVVTQGQGKFSPFTDVKVGAWYYDDVLSAHERGLVNGMTATTYEPNGSLTLAQAVKLAACMHQLYHEGSVSLTNSPAGTLWYRSYVDYALENGILDRELADYDAAATRREFVSIFYRALPSREYAAINDIPDGAIPDLANDDACAGMVYAFYRAGILTGYTADGTYQAHAFGPDTTIIRAEVATIMNRMFDGSARQRFTID